MCTTATWSTRSMEESYNEYDSQLSGTVNSNSSTVFLFLVFLCCYHDFILVVTKVKLISRS